MPFLSRKTDLDGKDLLALFVFGHDNFAKSTTPQDLEHVVVGKTCCREEDSDGLRCEKVGGVGA